MEFYSERCHDWLEKNDKIHPDKIRMEIKRFESLLSQAEQESLNDNIDDLSLTIQFLNERLSSLSDVKTSITNNEFDAQKHDHSSDDGNWDSSSLTNFDPKKVERLSPVEKQERHAALLTFEGIQLGTNSLKKRDLNQK